MRYIIILLTFVSACAAAAPVHRENVSLSVGIRTSTAEWKEDLDLRVHFKNVSGFPISVSRKPGVGLPDSNPKPLSITVRDNAGSLQPPQLTAGEPLFEGTPDCVTLAPGADFDAEYHLRGALWSDLTGAARVEFAYEREKDPCRPSSNPMWSIRSNVLVVKKVVVAP